MEAKIFSPELLKEIRDKFVYIDWDPYTGKRIHIEDQLSILMRRKLVYLLNITEEIPLQIMQTRYLKREWRTSKYLWGVNLGKLCLH